MYISNCGTARYLLTYSCMFYFNLQLISSVDPKFLKLTKVDDQIFTEFKKTFGDMNINVLNPEDLKSEEAKQVRFPVSLIFKPLQ